MCNRYGLFNVLFVATDRSAIKGDSIRGDLPRSKNLSRRECSSTFVGDELIVDCRFVGDWVI